MAVHLVLVACLAAPPEYLPGDPLPEVVSEDVVELHRPAKAKSEEWQSQAHGLSRHRHQMREGRGQQHAASAARQLQLAKQKQSCPAQGRA